MKRLLILLAILALPGFAQINNYYVSTTGSDANNGASSTPWRTLTYAANHISLGSAGTTVHVANGTYNEAVILGGHASGTSSQPVTFVSDTKWGAKIVSALSGSDSYTILIYASYLTAKNFDVSGSGVCIGIWMDGGNQHAVGNNVHNDGNNCESTGHAGVSGIAATNHNVGVGSNTAIGNFVHDTGMNSTNPRCVPSNVSSLSSGIYFQNPNDVIDNNLVVRVCGDAIALWHGATNERVINNTVLNSRDGLELGSGDDPCNNGTTGCPGGDDNTIFSNNIIAGMSLSGIYSTYADGGSIGIHNQINYNLLYNNAADFRWQSGAVESCTPGCITGQNPLFVNNTGTSSGDYHLQSTSPAIGAGTTTNALSTDFDGTARPQGGSYDIGAYEFASGGSVPSITSVTATPSGTIASGTAVTIAWASTGGLTATLNGAAVAVSGSQVFTPTVTTTYTLIVSNASGPSTPQAVTVTVSAVAKPTISSFTATPSTPITPGSPVTIAWTSTNGLTATLNGAPVVLGGSQVFNPLVTTDYVLIISNSAGPTSQTLTVSVGALPVISSFTASPSTIALGGSSTLTLVSTGGTSCSINQGVGTVACNSSTIVSPVTSKLYTATVANGFGSKTARAFVGVSISALLGATVVDGQVVIH